MKSKIKILSLTIGAFLAAGAIAIPMPSFADNSHGSNSSDDSRSSNNSDNSHSSNSSDDSHSSNSSDNSHSSNRSNSISSDNEGHSNEGNTPSNSENASTDKITICHIPPGNPNNPQTINIDFSAWQAHKAHNDYLGSCNSRSATTIKETLHVITGCQGAYHDTLATKVHSYYEPITVADSALDDESVVTAVSQCLDKGDSSKNKSDNDKNKANKGKGGGHDSVSDSGNHHRIRGCQNKDTTHNADSSQNQEVSDEDRMESNLNYHKKLKAIDANYDNNHHLKDPIVVSDSSLDDKDVWKEYKTCVKKGSSDSTKNRIDSGKIGRSKGDSGHKQHILQSCGETQDQALRNKIAAYKAKTSTKDIVLTESSYNDVWVKKAVEDCTDPAKGKGKDKVVSNSSTGSNSSSSGSNSSGTGSNGTNSNPNGSGDNPGGNPGGNPGNNPGDNPGDNPGNNPGDNPGGNPGDNPGGNPPSSTGTSGRLNFREVTSPIKN